MATGCGLLLLQGWLVYLWDDRARVGLAMPFDVAMPPGDPVPHLGYWIYFFPLAILSLVAFSRLAEARPKALGGLMVDMRSMAGYARSFLGLLVLYSGLGVLAAVIEHLFFHHFLTGPAHHVVVVMVLLGAAYAGRRRPFLHLGLSPGTDVRSRRRRRWASGLCVGLFAAAYASWIAQRRLMIWRYHLSAEQNALLVLATLVLAVLFAWALLHSSLMSVAGRAVGALEARSVAVEAAVRRPWLRAVTEWASHFAAVALLLGAAAGIWQWGGDSSTSGGSRIFLGVDWYFLDLWSAVTAAEAVLVPAVAVLGGLGVYRALSLATSRRVSQRG